MRTRITGMLLATAVIVGSAAVSLAPSAASEQAAVRPATRWSARPLHPPEVYARAKAAAAARAASGGGFPPPAGPRVPVLGPSWQGLGPAGNGLELAPPDPTGAAGPTRYVEMINTQMGIYDRTGVAIATFKLSALTGHIQSNLTDPQVLWDPDTQRFYFAVLDFDANTIAWGFSKTASPSGISGFCRYTADFGYGTDSPDYPKLGQTTDFLLIGVNVFAGFTYLGSDVDWITKPAAGAVTACPDQASFQLGVRSGLKDANGTFVNTPVPALQVDTSGTGWVVADTDVTVLSSSDVLTVYRATKKTGSGVLQLSKPINITVAPYEFPSNAEQCGTRNVIDTLDGRLTHAVAAIDPSRGPGAVAVWTAHAVYGGAGAEERWYEIDPAGAALYQSGKVTIPTGSVFNGAISPDRTVRPSVAAHGENMVLEFNTSSRTKCPAIQMASKVGSNPQSGLVLVKQSPGSDVDFSCQPCRWGDYSGASPDPAADPLAATGGVWMSNQWNVASTNNHADWRTWNWQATP